MLRGFCRGWPVVQTALRSVDDLFSYLAGMDSGITGDAFIGTRAMAGRYSYAEGLNGFNFEREPLCISKVLDRLKSRAGHADAEPIYLGSLPTDVHLPEFESQNRAEVLPQTVHPRIWIGNASLVSCHFDAQDNLACSVAGRRRFTLYPPQAISQLYVGPIDYTMAGQPISFAVGSNPGDSRYPDFEDLRDTAWMIDLEPGDALYLPKLWWHQVEALAPVNVLVNYWWDAFRAGPDAPYTTMMLAMIAIAERPEVERAAWRAFFDHYVFRPKGHPLRHLPAEKHGMLGPLAQGNYGRIRAIVMRLLRGA